MDKKTAEDEYYHLDDDTINKIIFTKENVKHMKMYQKSM